MSKTETLRPLDDILASGFITLDEYIDQLAKGSARDDLSWDYLSDAEDTDFLESYGFEGEWSYGVNMTPSRYVVGLLRLLKERLGEETAVVNIWTEQVELKKEDSN